MVIKVDNYVLTKKEVFWFYKENAIPDYATPVKEFPKTTSRGAVLSKCYSCGATTKDESNICANCLMKIDERK